MGWIAVFFSILGIFLLGRKDRRGFLCGFVSEFFWILEGVENNLVSLCVVCMIFAAMGFRNYLLWGRSRPKVILFVGHGRAGKDTACEIFSRITGSDNAGTCSKYLAEYVAANLSLPVEVAYARRHESSEMRMTWYELGNKIRDGKPTALVERMIANGNVGGGMRSYEEIFWTKKLGLADLIVWIENDRVPKDPTVKFLPSECDIVIHNNGSLEEFKETLLRLAKATGPWPKMS